MIRFNFFIFQLILFWLLFFALGRAFFLLFFAFRETAFVNIDFLEIFATFWHAIYLDFATVCYVLIPSFFIFLLQFFFKKNLFLHRLHFVIQLFLVFLTALASVTEPLLYQEWRTKINYKALQLFFQTPTQAFEIVSYSQLFFVFFFCLVFFGIGFFFLRILFFSTHYFSLKIYQKILFSLIFPTMVVLGLRGGWQHFPISQSDVYFSTYPLLNHAAVNVLWNIGQSIDKSSLDIGRYQKMEIAQAHQRMIEAFNAEKVEVPPLFKIKNPNIVLLILESFSADGLPFFGGDTIAPFLDSLAREGLAFVKTLSSGTLSDEGTASIFSGFPSQPLNVITHSFEKYCSLSFLPKDLEKIGYHTSFYSGVDLAYGNIYSFLIDLGMKEVFQEKNFPQIPKKERGRLGIHDHAMLPIFLESLSEKKEPFFSAFFSMSTHSPYDYPFFPDPKIRIEDENSYLNGMRFTDEQLRIFFEKAKQKQWYKETIFIILADHSHSTHKKNNYFSAAHHHIPFFFFGGALNDFYQKKIYDFWVNHHDLPKTLLMQLDQKEAAEKYFYSRDLFSKNQDFAYYSFTDGAGIVSDKGICAYDYRLQSIVFEDWKKETTTQEKEKQLELLQAYLQYLSSDYEKR